MSKLPVGRLTLPDIVAAAFTLLVRYAVRFYSLALILAALALADFVGVDRLASLFGVQAQTSANGNSTDVGSIAGVYAFLFCALLAFALLNFLSDALLVPLALDALAGRTPRIGAGLTTFWAALPAVLGVWIVVSLTLGILSITAIGIPVAIYLFVRWGFAVQVICEEGTSPLAALRRSAEIVRGRWWRTAAVLAVFIVLLLAAQLVVDRAFNLGGGIADSALAVALFWVLTPYSVVGRTLLYADTKARAGEQLQPPRALAG